MISYVLIYHLLYYLHRAITYINVNGAPQENTVDAPSATCAGGRRVLKGKSALPLPSPVRQLAKKTDAPPPSPPATTASPSISPTPAGGCPTVSDPIGPTRPTCAAVGDGCRNASCCDGLTCASGNPKKCELARRKLQVLRGSVWS